MNYPVCHSTLDAVEDKVKELYMQTSPPPFEQIGFAFEHDLDGTLCVLPGDWSWAFGKSRADSLVQTFRFCYQHAQLDTSHRRKTCLSTYHYFFALLCPSDEAAGVRGHRERLALVVVGVDDRSQVDMESLADRLAKAIANQSRRLKQLEFQSEQQKLERLHAELHHAREMVREREREVQHQQFVIHRLALAMQIAPPRVEVLTGPLVTVVLESCGQNKVEIYRIIRRVTYASLSEVVEIVRAVPITVYKGLAPVEAVRLCRELEICGARTRIQASLDDLDHANSGETQCDHGERASPLGQGAFGITTGQLAVFDKVVAERAASS